MKMMITLFSGVIMGFALSVACRVLLRVSRAASIFALDVALTGLIFLLHPYVGRCPCYASECRPFRAKNDAPI